MKVPVRLPERLPLLHLLRLRNAPLNRRDARAGREGGVLKPRVAVGVRSEEQREGRE